MFGEPLGCDLCIADFILSLALTGGDYVKNMFTIIYLCTHNQFRKCDQYYTDFTCSILCFLFHIFLVMKN